MKAPQVAPQYANHNIYLFMGGFFIAMAMQKWGLHRRIALQVIRALGTGYLNIPEMCRTGIGLNLIGVVIITAVTYFITVPVFGITLRELPLWAP